MKETARNFRHLLLAFASSGAIAAALPEVALAQAPAATAASDSQQTLSEIVVTAQKREERVEKVPESITVVSQQQLERQQIYNVFDLSRVAPALNVTNATGQNVGGGGIIRGIGTQSFGVGAVGSVGIVVDGVSQGNVNISDLFDIARVEVLKGPQGTLFGLTTSAGVINITTNAPNTTQYSARVRTELSGEGIAGSTGYGQQVYQAVANIPVAGIAGFRVAANFNDRQGPDRNALLDTLDAHNSYSFRVRGLIQPTPDLTINLNGDYDRERGNGADFFVMYKANPALTNQLANCSLNGGQPKHPITVSDANRDYCSSYTNSDGTTNYGGSLDIAYDAKAFNVTSITAVRQQTQAPLTGLEIFRLDQAFYAPPPAVMPTRIDPISPPETSPSTLFTQEFRIASPTGTKLEYTAGAFYSNYATKNQPGGVTTVSDTFFPGAPPLILNQVTSSFGTSQDVSAALFGQATYHLTDKISLIGGLRYTNETLKELTSVSNVVRTGSIKESNWSWKVGGQYQFDPTLMSYVTISRGYKGPQFGSVPTGAPAGTLGLPVQAEIPTEYEIGAKKTLFGGRAVVDLSAFYINDDNYQGQLCATNPITQLLSCTITNFEGVVSKGIEATVFGRVNEHLTLNSGIIWNPATYPSHGPNGGPYLASDGTDLSGGQLISAPLWKYTFSVEYTQKITARLEGFVAGDAVFQSKTRYGNSSDPNLFYPDNWVLGLQGGVRSADGRWTIAAFARNLTDEHVPVLRQAGFPYGANYGQFLSTNSFRVVGIRLEAGF